MTSDDLDHPALAHRHECLYIATVRDRVLVRLLTDKSQPSMTSRARRHLNVETFGGKLRDNCGPRGGVAA